MSYSRYRKGLTVAALLVAILFLLIGSRRTYKVYDSSNESVGLVGVRRISDRQMVIDTTFSGVTRKGRKLYSTYDRNVTGGKRACPT